MTSTTEFGDEGYRRGRFVVDATSGGPRLLWTRTDFAGPESMLLHDGVLYVTDNGCDVHAIDISTGHDLWYVITEEDTSLSSMPWMEVEGQVLHVFAALEMDADIDISQGVLLRTYDPGASPFAHVTTRTRGNPALAPNVDRRVTYDEATFQLSGHDASGATIWHTESSPFAPSIPFALREGNTVVFVDPGGNVVGIDWPG